jgi:hypothetical protein
MQGAFIENLYRIFHGDHHAGLPTHRDMQKPCTITLLDFSLSSFLLDPPPPHQSGARAQISPLGLTDLTKHLDSMTLIQGASDVMMVSTVI